MKVLIIEEVKNYYMKKIVLIIVVFCFGVLVSNAQNKQERQLNKNNIEALKVAYITRQLNLTPEEAQRFWPVHNIYFEELKKTRRDNLDNELAFEEKALNIRKRYSTDFKKILDSEERVNKLFKSEKDFNNELRKELLNRKSNNPNFKKRVDQPPVKNNN